MRKAARDGDQVWGLGLEEKCQRAGVWLIQGCEVVRARDGHETYWTIFNGDRVMTTAATLNDAREWIAKERR
jgi:hypothetical protein